MKTQEIADKLVNWCRNGQMEKCYQELYSPAILSVESGDGSEATGFEELQKKGEWWRDTFEVHSMEVGDPVVADNWFTVKFKMDTTHKPSGQRSTESEIAVYRTENGKITREEFFYDQPAG
ncbi:MAG: nuclear transport factor 2 family protein [Leeuwenhoekiella sp.]